MSSNAVEKLDYAEPAQSNGRLEPTSHDQTPVRATPRPGDLVEDNGEITPRSDPVPAKDDVRSGSGVVTALARNDVLDNATLSRPMTPSLGSRRALRLQPDASTPFPPLPSGHEDWLPHNAVDSPTPKRQKSKGVSALNSELDQSADLQNVQVGVGSTFLPPYGSGVPAPPAWSAPQANPELTPIRTPQVSSPARPPRFPTPLHFGVSGYTSTLTAIPSTVPPLPTRIRARAGKGSDPQSRRGLSKRSRRARSGESSGEESNHPRRDGPKKRLRREREDKQTPPSNVSVPASSSRPEMDDVAILTVATPRVMEATDADMALPSAPASPSPTGEAQDADTPMQTLSAGYSGQVNAVEQPYDSMAVDSGDGVVEPVNIIMNDSEPAVIYRRSLSYVSVQRADRGDIVEATGDVTQDVEFPIHALVDCELAGFDAYVGSTGHEQDTSIAEGQRAGQTESMPCVDELEHDIALEATHEAVQHKSTRVEPMSAGATDEAPLDVSPDVAHGATNEAPLSVSPDVAHGATNEAPLSVSPDVVNGAEASPQPSHADILVRCDDIALHATPGLQDSSSCGIVEGRDEPLPAVPSPDHGTTTNVCLEAELQQIRSMLDRLEKASAQTQQRDDAVESSGDTAVADAPIVAPRAQDGRVRFCLRLVQLTLQSVPTPYQDHTVLTPPSPRVPLPPPPSASTPPARSPPASTSPASAQYAPPASTPPAYAPFAPHGARRPLPASLLPASLPP
ncbi:hypothetical protein ONZ51_g4245 [Trametes cubensis]|uniref:Uncharacterized protein n=1 Tax=Trametes cubensis TaxID=1111947 RepID=A0AAD7TWE7_9APHY|nr:hypothetical protein ONZ51_g4245 [Trametes cubensis]